MSCICLKNYKKMLESIAGIEDASVQPVYNDAGYH